jgi:hypothetical protein
VLALRPARAAYARDDWPLRRQARTCLTRSARVDRWGR